MGVSEDGLVQASIQRNRMTVVIVDVYESVRLFEQSEDQTVAHWRALVRKVTEQILPSVNGRLIRSVGDGLLMSFPDELTASRAVLQLLEFSHTLNERLAAAQQLRLRAAATTDDLVLDELDVFGMGINTAARLLTICKPGEFVVTEAFRAPLCDGFDLQVFDLGECRLRNVSKPVRVFRIGKPGESGMAPDGAKLATVQTARDLEDASLAILPLQPMDVNGRYALLGTAMADQLISIVSRSSNLVVISRMSSFVNALQGMERSKASAILRARYVVTGSYQVHRNQLQVSIEVADFKSGSVIWAETLVESMADLIAAQQKIAVSAADNISSAVIQNIIRRTQTVPVYSLDTYSVLLGAVYQMHRMVRSEFERSKVMLEQLIEREPRNPVPLAWLAKWHILRNVQGWTENRLGDSIAAEALTGEALALDSENSLALSIQGLSCAYLRRDTDSAQECYRNALEANPNESLAWLFASTVHSYTEQGEEASRMATHACRLSPIDPLRYFYQSLAATAVLSNDEYERAIDLCRSSLRANRTHFSTYKTMIIAQALAGKIADAQLTTKQFLKLDPNFSVSRYLDQYPGTSVAQTARYADALRAAGVRS